MAVFLFHTQIALSEAIGSGPILHRLQASLRRKSARVFKRSSARYSARSTPHTVLNRYVSLCVRNARGRVPSQQAPRLCAVGCVLSPLRGCAATAGPPWPPAIPALGHDPPLASAGKRPRESQQAAGARRSFTDPGLFGFPQLLRQLWIAFWSRIRLRP
jgi:hypothetical protein